MKSKEVSFIFESHQVRVITDRNGEPWFVAADVCKILGLAQVTRALDRLDDDERQVIDFSSLNSKGRENQELSNFDPKAVNIINESGLYSLVLTSRKPEAKRFKKWITAEVLPSIRRTGSYTAGSAQDAKPAPSATEISTEFRTMLGLAMLIGMDKNSSIISANQAVNKRIGVNVLDLLGKTHFEAEDQESLVFTPSELGLRIGVSGQRFNLLLEKAELQTKKSGHWCPTEKAAGLFRIFDTGKRHMNGVPIQQIKWSEKVLRMVEGVAA